jgi:hypothetical protein
MMNKKIMQNPNNHRERVTCSKEHALLLKQLGWKEVEAVITPAKPEAKR